MGCAAVALFFVLFCLLGEVPAAPTVACTGHPSNVCHNCLPPMANYLTRLEEVYLSVNFNVDPIYTVCLTAGTYTIPGTGSIDYGQPDGVVFTVKGLGPTLTVLNTNANQNFWIVHSGTLVLEDFGLVNGPPWFGSFAKIGWSPGASPLPNVQVTNVMVSQYYNNNEYEDGYIFSVQRGTLSCSRCIFSDIQSDLTGTIVRMHASSSIVQFTDCQFKDITCRDGCIASVEVAGVSLTITNSIINNVVASATSSGGLIRQIASSTVTLDSLRVVESTGVSYMLLAEQGSLRVLNSSFENNEFDSGHIQCGGTVGQATLSISGSTFFNSGSLGPTGAVIEGSTGCDEMVLDHVFFAGNFMAISLNGGPGAPAVSDSVSCNFGVPSSATWVGFTEAFDCDSACSAPPRAEVGFQILPLGCLGVADALMCLECGRLPPGQTDEENTESSPNDEGSDGTQGTGAIIDDGDLKSNPESADWLKYLIIGVCALCCCGSAGALYLFVTRKQHHKLDEKKCSPNTETAMNTFPSFEAASRDRSMTVEVTRVLVSAPPHSSSGGPLDASTVPSMSGSGMSGSGSARDRALTSEVTKVLESPPVHAGKAVPFASSAWSTSDGGSSRERALTSEVTKVLESPPVHAGKAVPFASATKTSMLPATVHVEPPPPLDVSCTGPPVPRGPKPSSLTASALSSASAPAPPPSSGSSLALSSRNLSSPLSSSSPPPPRPPPTHASASSSALPSQWQGHGTGASSASVGSGGPGWTMNGSTFQAASEGEGQPRSSTFIEAPPALDASLATRLGGPSSSSSPLPGAAPPSLQSVKRPPPRPVPSSAPGGGGGGGGGGAEGGVSNFASQTGRSVIKVSRSDGTDGGDGGGRPAFSSARRKVLVSMTVSATDAPVFDSTAARTAAPKGKVDLEIDTSMEVLSMNDPNVVKVAYLGAGMFGTVYHYNWNYTSVAVKVLSKVTQSSIQDFIEEAQMLATLRCPHIVAYVGLCADPLAIVTEYMAGGDLAQYLKSVTEGKRPFDYSHHCTMALDILRGLVYLHSRGVAHRDLKPANVLLTNHFDAKIADFGLAGTKERDLSGAGTPRYTAPEVLAGKEGDLPADMYGYGCVLLETLTLIKPFASIKSSADRMLGNLAPADLAGTWAFPSHDTELKDLLHSLWSTAPSQRLSATGTMGALAALFGEN